MAANLVILLILAVCDAAATLENSVAYQALPGSKDMEFLEDLLFHRPAESIVECGQQCSQTDHCLVFTFRESSRTAASVCRGHNGLDIAALTTAPGAKTYILEQDWLNRPCSDDTDCQMILPINYETTLGNDSAPVCYDNLCLCYPGYFYSLGKTMCEQACSSPDLQDSYTRYPYSGIWENSNYSSWGTLDECKDMCSSVPLCENFKIRNQGSGQQECLGSSVSGYSNGFGSAYSWDHYQRNCV